MQSPNTKNGSETYVNIGAAISLHRELGHGFIEAVYQPTLQKELKDQATPFKRKKKAHVHYKDIVIANYHADFICYDKVIVKLKALKKITRTEKSQVINYLKATSYSIALLINFGSSSPQYERIVFNQRKSA